MSVAPASVVERRAFLRTAGFAGLGAAAVACAPAAAPSAPGAVPSASGNAPSPVASSAWQAEWDRLVVAAKQEGTLTAIVSPGALWQKAMSTFTQAFDIKVDAQGSGGAVWAPKIQTERSAGVYSVDVILAGPITPMSLLKPAGALDPVRPLIFRPDVLDDKAWSGGFESRFMDTAKQLAFAWDAGVVHFIAVNYDLVQPGEVKSVKDLLDAKWKGKMTMADVRNGGTFLAMTAVRAQFGDAAVKQLIVDQEPTLLRDVRLVVEGVVRGKFPIAWISDPVTIREFQDQGVGKNVKYLDTEADITPNISLFLVNRAPHPNVAKLFINWFLTKEGQTAFGKELTTNNSARTDVPPFNPDATPTPGRTYYSSGKEENFALITDTQKYLNGLVGITN